MAAITPSYTIVNPSYIAPEMIIGYQQASGAFETIASGNPQVRLGVGDQYVYMRRLDIRTQTTSSQSGNGNQLPSVALDAKMISTPTYLFRCRGIYDHHDMAAAGNWNFALPEAQRLGMRQGIFQQLRSALLYGMNPAGGEGLLNTAGATTESLPPDSNGNTTVLTYDHGQMAVGSVNQILTSLPSDITLTCTNPVAGTPGGAPETNYEFRERVWEGQMSTVQGYPGFIRQKLTDLNSVQARLVSVVQSGNAWIVMCGGGDIYDMAGAIYKSAGDISRLKGTDLNVTGITNANPGVITTDITHGFSSGQVINITGVTGMSGINNVPLTITVLSSHTFSIGINTTSSGTWTGGGVVTPNLRNNVVTINDWPDNYLIPFVVPLQQLVTIKFEWATESANYLTDATIASLVTQPVINYVNGIFAGKPMNINNIKDVFLQSINGTLDMSLISTLNVVVTVNGVITGVDAGTNIISGDPYSYWYMASNGVIVDGI